MLTAYVEAAMHRARYEILPEDGSFYGEIPECNGIFAHAASLEACRDQLREVLEDWILLRTREGLPLPTIDGIELSIQDAAEGDELSRMAELAGETGVSDLATNIDHYLYGCPKVGDR